eukprot:CAMPEP_0174947598 /NCGR_PEP_ID=MMETSP1355-20121228/86991_1 /TAXON_ID=464990 /ORGANISM="Hemiselmis tepida, Strain CCMP443" /LENGTH=65 /DNA_ID=CAMNT_0016195077 /DNA_START=71 /DNA_END=265 /DNA_ORIENTATION=+
MVGHGLAGERYRLDGLVALARSIGALVEHEERDGVWRPTDVGVRGFMAPKFEELFRPKRPSSVPL